LPVELVKFLVGSVLLGFIIKRVESDVLNVDIKYSKTTQKETKRNYKFSKTHQTTKVKFYDYNPYEDVKNLFVEVPIEKIASNAYSLNYAEYMKDEKEEEKYEDGVVVKKLGEVCKFLPKSKRNAGWRQVSSWSAHCAAMTRQARVTIPAGE